MDFAIVYNATKFTFEIFVRDGDIATDGGLLAAVLASLFTDRRANDDDELPGNDGDKRGSWQDQYLDDPDDLQGSRLWLLDREKELPDVLHRAQEYAEEALAWFVEDGIARSVSVPCEWVRPDAQGRASVAGAGRPGATGVLGLLIDIWLVDGSRFKTAINYPLEG